MADVERRLQASTQPGPEGGLKALALPPQVSSPLLVPHAATHICCMYVIRGLNMTKEAFPVYIACQVVQRCGVVTLVSSAPTNICLHYDSDGNKPNEFVAHDELNSCLSVKSSST